MPLSGFTPMWHEPYQYNQFYEWDETQYHQQPISRPLEEPKFPHTSDLIGYDHHQVTAIGKPCPLFEDLYAKKEEIKPMKQWSPREVLEWMCEEANKCNLNFERIDLDNFRNVDGCTLLKMTPQEFIEKDNYFGSFLYQAVDRHRRSEEACQDNLPPFKNIRHQEDVVYTDLSESMGSRPANSDNDSFISDTSSHDISDVKPTDVVPKPTLPPVRRPGRPPKQTRTKRGNKEKKCGRLWEFIRDLLLKPEYCPSLICWENHDEGIFRFVRSDKVAELWGTIKENPKMTYEKLSRAMRYYYKSKVLQPVLGRRLVYKFGPTARGWRTNNPNFRDSPK